MEKKVSPSSVLNSTLTKKIFVGYLVDCEKETRLDKNDKN